MSTSLKLYFTLKSFNNTNINLFLNFLIKKFNNYLGYKFNIIRLPKTIKKYTVLRSPHINKKAREQFEMRIYTTQIVLEINKNKVNFLPIIVNKIIKTVPPAITIKWQKIN